MQRKLSEKVLMLIMTLAIIVIGVIVVAILSNNKVMANDEHKHTLIVVNCNKTEITFSHEVSYACIGCDYKCTVSEKCNITSYEKIDEKTHRAQCNKCYDCYVFVHVDNDKNGICDKCLNNSGENNQKHICTKNGKEKITGYSKSNTYMNHIEHYHCTTCDFKYDVTEKCNPTHYYKLNENNHIAQCGECYQYYEFPHVDNDKNGICDACLYVIADCSVNGHVFGEYISKGSAGHSRICEKCGYELIQTHEGATHENGGKCTAKGCGYQYEIHQNSNILCGYSDITDTTHTRIYKCTKTGCNKTFKGAPENHDYKNGKCACGKESTEIKIESEIYEIDDTYVSKVIPKQTVNTVKNNIKASGAEINIYDKEDNLIQGITRVGTGARVEIKNENETKNLIVIVNGDVNGDADADFKDIVKMNQARLNKEKLDYIYSSAADVNGDGKVDLKDIVKINQFRLNKIKEL